MSEITLLVSAPGINTESVVSSIASSMNLLAPNPVNKSSILT